MQRAQSLRLGLPKRCLCLAFLLLHLLGQVAATQRCPPSCPAPCPKKPPTCAPGVRAVLDDCSCCLVCARQRGESCSVMLPCEESRGLFCDRRADPSAQTGICMAIEGDNCVFDGVIYQSGETFQPSCKYQCACQDGQVGCVPRCEEDLLLPQPDCPAPRKVKVPGECCEKWICDSNETGTLGDLQTLPGEKFRRPKKCSQHRNQDRQEAGMLFGVCSEKLASVSGRSVVESSLPTEIKPTVESQPSYGSTHPVSPEEEGGSFEPQD